MRTILTIVLLILRMLLFSQNYTISGYVTDINSGEALIGASVYDLQTKTGTITNEYGYYALSLPKGNYTIAVSYIGYVVESIRVDLIKNIVKKVKLKELTIEINDVVIVADSKGDKLRSNEFSIDKLTLKDIKKLPGMFGANDVIKAIQLQTGVKTIGDGSSGMFVRGGGSDQNLILIDEAPIYNPSHLFGLVSVFNPDALNSIVLYKSNMPANYGGRASSVLDCKMNEGNNKKNKASVGLNIFAADVSIEGPIVKDKSSFILTARKSFVDLFLTPGPTMPLVPAFYDLNGKVNIKINNSNKVFLSIYHGNDKLESVDGFFNKWGNTIGTIRWNHIFGNRLFTNTSFIISEYNNNLEFVDGKKNYKWLTGLKDLNFKYDMSYYLKPKNSIKIGFSSIYHKFIPGETKDITQSISRIQALEHAIYVLNDIKPTSWLGVNYGMRFSLFQNIGEAKWYSYDENYKPIKMQTNLKGVYNKYFYLEPRISINIRVSTKHSIKLAYARNAQYMQVLQNNSLSYTSLETWFPSNPNIKPLLADVVSLGWFHKLSERYFISIESYYKAYQNQIDYIDHAKLINNPFIVSEIRTGTAKAYGVEILLNKHRGSFTGNISYNYSRALRKISDINNGDEFSSPYDIPNDFRVVCNYQLSKKISFSSAWVYSSGRPVTLPIGFYYEDKVPIPIYSERNSSRFPSYHRLDISALYSTKIDGNTPYWDFGIGVYNLYGRRNPIGYSFENYIEGMRVYEYTLFTFMPNFSIKLHL